MLDEPSDHLLPEMLEPYGRDVPLPSGPSGDQGASAQNASNAGSTTSLGTCVLSHEPNVVTKHRRIKKNFKVSIIQEIVAECKVKFYGATDTVANRKAIHRFGTRFCEHHGMRTQHIREVMPTVVELVLTPDKWEIEARNIASTRLVQTRRGNRLSMWHRFLNWIDGDEACTLKLEC